MRITLALAAASFAVAGLASSADATCMTRTDKYTGITTTSCSAPGGPVYTTICYRDAVCVSY